MMKRIFLLGWFAVSVEIVEELQKGIEDTAKTINASWTRSRNFDGR